LDLLGPNPPGLDVLPVQGDPPSLNVEEERMDREHRGLVAGTEHGTAGDESSHVDPGLLEDLAAGPP